MINGDAIVPANIRAMSAIYFSAMLDQLKAYDVADRLLALFLDGLLPIGPGARDVLDRYWRGATERISNAERRSVYGRALGIPGGDPGGTPNRDFNDLWLRFISSVSALAKQHAADTAQGASPSQSIGQHQVRTTGRGLARNVSRHGADLIPMATAINDERVEMMSVLADQDVQRAYGVRGVWQLIERVSAQELGGARPSAPRRAMAESGAVIFAWLATRPPAFWRMDGDAIDFSEQRAADHPSTNPTDYDLVNACEQWLAASGIEGPRIEERTQPLQTVDVREAVGSLLSRSPGFESLAPAVQARVAGDTARVADYLAAPESTEALRSLVAAVDFPAFVADLIHGVFDAVVDASIRQMEAYADLIAAVAASLDAFRDDSVSDREARERLCEHYPALCEPASGTDQTPARYRQAVADGVWRRHATTRQQMLATMVMMGVNRIVVTN